MKPFYFALVCCIVIVSACNNKATSIITGAQKGIETNGNVGEENDNVLFHIKQIVSFNAKPDTSPTEKNIFRGKQLYKSNCAPCHPVFKLSGGGPMAGTMDRVPGKEWIYKFMSSPAKMIASGDPYALKIFEQYKPTVMTAFPSLGKKGIDAIYDYIKYQERLYPDSLKYVQLKLK